MRLACFDLDNTLIDRDGAFLAWARWWVDRAGLGPAVVDWLVAHDNGGFMPRGELFACFEEQFGLSISVDDYDREHPGFSWVEPAATMRWTHRLRTIRSSLCWKRSRFS